MIAMTRRGILLGIVGVMLALNTGCLTQKKIREKAGQLAQPQAVEPVHRPVDPILKSFGDIVRAVVVAMYGDSEIPIEVGLIRGDKDHPDIVDILIRAIDGIGSPFVSYREVPVPVVDSPFRTDPRRTPQHGSDDKPQVGPPPPVIKIDGGIERVQELIEIDSSDGVTITAGKGKGSFDGDGNKGHHALRTSYTIALNFADARGITRAGGTSVQRIHVDKVELDGSIGWYLGGSGIHLGRKVSLQSEITDSIYQATAYCLLELMSRFYGLPLNRVSSDFPIDAALTRQIQRTWNRQTVSQLERTLKIFLFLQYGGEKVDMSNLGLTDADRMLVLQDKPIDWTNRSQLISAVNNTFDAIDFSNAATLVEDRLDEVVRRRNEAAENKNAHAPDVPATSPSGTQSTIGPDNFGWPPSTKIVVLDLSRVKQLNEREAILAAVIHCIGCSEIRATDASKTLIGIRVTNAAEVQSALRRSSLVLDYVWTDFRLLVMTKK